MSIFEEVGTFKPQPRHHCPGCGRTGIGRAPKLCWRCEDEVPAKPLKYPRVCRDCHKDFSSKRPRRFCIKCRHHRQKESWRDNATRSYAKAKREGRLAARFQYRYEWRKTLKGQIAKQRGSAKVSARRRMERAARGLKKKPASHETRLKMSAANRRRYARNLEPSVEGK